jgi:hypothetical protein
MRYAYLTLDQVNQDWAERLAAQAGAELEVVSPRDILAAGPFDALLIDLDSLPPGYRKAALDDLLAGKEARQTAVHSYHLRIRDARVLRRRGVIVARRLEVKIFQRLRKTLAVQLEEKTAPRSGIHYDGVKTLNSPAL